MDFKKFSVLIVIRTILAMVTLLLLAQFISGKGYHATILLLSIVLVFQFFEITRFVAKTNAELTRFFDAVRYADFSQRFELKNFGTGFDDLGQAFSEVLTRIQKVRSTQEEELRQIKAVIEHVPVPLISLYSDGRVSLWNNSARKLFGTNSVANLQDLARFDEKFPSQLLSIIAGERRLININIDDMEHRLIISATQVITANHQETVISMQDIQSELASAQLQAWQDLVSVLTHEIMNSITPVASLAKTTVDLVEDVKDKFKTLSVMTSDLNRDSNEKCYEEINEELADVLGAVQTVARRSDSLMQFVTSYRRLTRLPAPNKKMIKLKTLFNHVENIATQHWPQQGIKLITKVIPSELDFYVDHHMIEQVLINLLKNAEQALTHISSAEVNLSAYLNLRGHVVIDVGDNGTGIEEDIAGHIFVPFFTTKKEGSGVGLALTRQVMLAHDGKVALRNNSAKGVTFSLTF